MNRKFLVWLHHFISKIRSTLPALVRGEMHKLESPLKFCQYGSNNGRIVFYFHGASGAAEEGSIFDTEGKNHDLTFICLERFSVDPSINGEAYYRALAAEVSRIASGKEVDFVGFSIGAFIAVQVIRYMPSGIGNLHLVSAAALSTPTKIVPILPT